MILPFERSGIDANPTKAAWDATAAELLGSMLERWHLSDPQVFPATAAALVAAVRRRDGTPAVLKIGFPHEEAIWEAAMLEALPCDLAPRVLEQDPWTWAMLLERLMPGSTLRDSGLAAEAAIDVGAHLHRRIAATPPPDGVPRLAEQYRPFVDRLSSATASALFAAAGLPTDSGAWAIEEFGRLCDTAPADALLHGDLNPGNVLRAADGWRVIDPKPAVGDPAFDTFSLVRDLVRDPAEHDAVAGLTERAAGTSGVDGDRAFRWLAVRGILSAFWNLEDGLVEAGRRDARLVQSANDLLGR